MVIVTVLFLMALPVPAFAEMGVPALLWKSDSCGTELPNLHSLSPAGTKPQYHQVLDSMDSGILIIFLVSELNVEDFSGYPDALYQLQREFESSEHVFVPSVPPVRVDELQSFEIIDVNTNDLSSVRLADGVSKTLMLVRLQDRPAADRRQVLLHLDSTVREVLEQVRSLTDSYVAMLTGQYTSMGGEIETRHSRDLKAISDPPTSRQHMFLNLGCILFYTSDSPVIHFQSMKATTANRALLLPLGSPSSNSSSCNGTDVNTATIIWQHANSTSVDLAGVTLKLTFKANMTKPGGSDVSFWTLGEVTLSYAGNIDDKGVSKAVVELDFEDVYAPRHFSYHCTNRMWAAEPSANGTDTDAPLLTALHLPGFQVQAFIPSGGKARFGRAWDCTTFFTIPILSGLFVSLIMLVSLVISVMMLINVPPLERFDNPHGPMLMSYAPVSE